MKPAKEFTVKDRIEEISKLIYEVANGNFDYKIESKENLDDDLEAIVWGVNMLGQQLKTSVVSRDYMQGIYNGVIDMLIIMDADLRIKTINGAVEELLGYSSQEVVSKPLREILAGSSTEALINSIKSDLKNSGQRPGIEMQFTARSGIEIPTSGSFSMLYNGQGQVDGVMLIAKDISQLKETEKQLRKAKDEAEEANRAKGRFLSNMSHEIRTPLNGIVGFTELLMTTNTSKVQLEYLSMIHSSGETLAKLLNDVLDLNKIDLDKLQLEKVPFDFREIVNSNLNPYKYLASEKTLKFNYVISEDVPKTILGDPTRINQILVNLVSNSLKFTEKGSVEVEFTTRNDESGHLHLYCEVRDTGIGIPPEKHQVIFETFTQSDSSTTRRYGGSGLGLAICKQLVVLMKGEIGLESPLHGQSGGTRFWFQIPIESVEPAEELQSPATEKLDFTFEKPTNILVVDDNHVNLVLIKKLLSSLGATVVSAIHGKDAVEKAAQQKFDLIFMDIQMPVQDGFSATAELRRKGFQNPILALSANVDKDNIEKCQEVGMNDYLQKPFHKKQLIVLLEKWVHNSVESKVS